MKYILENLVKRDEDITEKRKELFDDVWSAVAKKYDNFSLSYRITELTSLTPEEKSAFNVQIRNNFWTNVAKIEDKISNIYSFQNKNYSEKELLEMLSRRYLLLVLTVDYEAISQ